MLNVHARDCGVDTQWGCQLVVIVVEGLHGQTHTSTLLTNIGLLPGGQLFSNQQIINLSQIYGQQYIAGEVVEGPALVHRDATSRQGQTQHYRL